MRGTCFIISGVPGIGKSRLADHIWRRMVQAGLVIVQLNTDRFHENPETGKYEFDPGKAGEAHNWTFRGALAAFGWHRGGCEEVPADAVIVDNTNCTAAEMSPYILAAAASGYEVKIIRVLGDYEAAYARNSHGVPREVFDYMVEEFDKKALAPWWDVAEYQTDTAAKQFDSAFVDPELIKKDEKDEFWANEARAYEW